MLLLRLATSRSLRPGCGAFFLALDSGPAATTSGSRGQTLACCLLLVLGSAGSRAGTVGRKCPLLVFHGRRPQHERHGICRWWPVGAAASCRCSGHLGHLHHLLPVAASAAQTFCAGGPTARRAPYTAYAVASAFLCTLCVRLGGQAFGVYGTANPPRSLRVLLASSCSPMRVLQSRPKHCWQLAAWTHAVLLLCGGS